MNAVHNLRILNAKCNQDLYVDPQNELSDLYTPDYREQAPNEDAYLDQAYEDRFELPCMVDYQ